MKNQNTYPQKVDFQSWYLPLQTNSDTYIKQKPIQPLQSGSHFQHTSFPGLPLHLGSEDTGRYSPVIVIWVKVLQPTINFLVVGEDYFY